jgi:putative transcription factor
MCGKQAELFTAVVEGTQMMVCANCGSFGKVLRKVQPPAASKPAFIRREPVQVEQVVSDYAQRIKAAREKRGMTQEDFAKLVTVKESLIHKMETGQFEPPIDIARKMEKALHITLVEVREESAAAPAPKGEKSEGLTIGDIMNLKR